MIGIDCAANIVDRIIEDKPTAVNPIGDFYDECLYQAYDDPNHRCVVGEFLFVIGETVPGPNDFFGAFDLPDRGYTDLLTNEALHFLAVVQGFADSGSSSEIPWGQSIDIDRAKKIVADRLRKDSDECS